MIGSYCMYPLERNMEERLIIQYLTPMGEYQEVSKKLYKGSLVIGLRIGETGHVST